MFDIIQLNILNLIVNIIYFLVFIIVKVKSVKNLHNKGIFVTKSPLIALYICEFFNFGTTKSSFFSSFNVKMWSIFRRKLIFLQNYKVS